jgi:hypothetical protein
LDIVIQVFILHFVEKGRSGSGRVFVFFNVREWWY